MVLDSTNTATNAIFLKMGVSLLAPQQGNRAS